MISFKFSRLISMVVSKGIHILQHPVYPGRTNRRNETRHPINNLLMFPIKATLFALDPRNGVILITGVDIFKEDINEEA
jgi:hypothetical protein